MDIRITNIRPPRIAQILVLTAVLLHWLTPLDHVYVYSSQVPGIILGICGFGIMMWGWWLFKKYDTAICPTAETDRLVMSGIFRLSRNPMYLGMVVMLLALSILVGTLPFYLATVVFFVVINNFFCPYEENKLAVAFGDTYMTYKNTVRRWL